MALFVRQDSERTRLQERLAAELREKAKKQSNMGDDLSSDDNNVQSRYVKDTQGTGKFAWVWIVLTIAAVLTVLWLTIL
jgi:hypothetical protein